LQEPVDRFARALTVPRRLLALHPRQRGNPGDAAALAPAITLGVIAAFEGFVEEFVAVAALRNGLGLAQIAKAVGKLNNPDLKIFESLAVNQLGVPGTRLGRGYLIDQWTPPPPESTWWQVGQLNWRDAKRDAEAWMQVRHLLTHGLTSGWRAERWPGPLAATNPPPPSASSVLRQTPSGKHTLVIHGAISCARIYVEGARHIAQAVADHLSATVNLSVVPEFPLYKEDRQQQVATPVLDEEAVQEGDEPAQD
jgi:hypothetical protein